MKIYLLVHVYEYGNDNEHEETKMLGIYSSMKNAEDAKKRYSNLDGFIKYDIECFSIYEYELNKDSEWTEGFMTWEEVENYQKENDLCREDEYKKSIFRNE